MSHRILLLLSCRAAGCMRKHGRGRTFVLVVRAAGSCARRIDGGSCGPPVFDGEVVCGVRHVLGTSPAKFPRLATAIHGLPARVVSLSRSASCAMPAPRVARGSMPDKINYS